MKRFLGMAVLVSLAGCGGPAPQPANDSAPAANTAAPAAAPGEAPGNTAAPAAQGLAGWLVGTWSFDAECATDLVIHYNADGSLQNAGDAGRWSLEGATVTETVTERFDMGDEAPIKVDPPEIRRYTAERTGQDSGVLTFNGKKIPIKRC